MKHFKQLFQQAFIFALVSAFLFTAYLISFAQAEEHKTTNPNGREPLNWSKPKSIFEGKGIPHPYLRDFGEMPDTWKEKDEQELARLKTPEHLFEFSNEEVEKYTPDLISQANFYDELQALKAKHKKVLGEYNGWHEEHYQNYNEAVWSYNHLEILKKKQYTPPEKIELLEGTFKSKQELMTHSAQKLEGLRSELSAIRKKVDFYHEEIKHLPLCTGCPRR